jgi:hypothetical protein
MLGITDIQSEDLYEAPGFDIELDDHSDHPIRMKHRVLDLSGMFILNIIQHQNSTRYQTLSLN